MGGGGGGGGSNPLVGWGGVGWGGVGGGSHPLCTDGWGVILPIKLGKTTGNKPLGEGRKPVAIR